MLLCMFSPKEMELERGWPGRVDGDRIIQLAAQTLQAFFTGGGVAREHAEYPLAECDLRAPVLQPPSVRVFAAFRPEAGSNFWFASPYPVLGPESELVYPATSRELVYAPGVAAVVGAEGEIAGFTAANCWTARDLARREAEQGAPPAKSSDFGFSLGPLLLTGAELERGRLLARVNGEERTSLDLRDLGSRWGTLRDCAAAGTRLRTGDLLIARAPLPDGPALVAGDLVEVELAGVGVLRNRVGETT
jgi:fumarylacetoacetate (FAA) hydrolase